MMHRSLLFSILIFLSLGQLPGQATTFTGCVTDAAGEPLIGVSVRLQDSPLGTITGIDGCFRLSVEADTVSLTFVYTGYEQQSIAIGKDQPTVNVSLSEAAVMAEEVMITGRMPDDARRESSHPLRVRTSSVRKDRTVASPSLAMPTPFAAPAMDAYASMPATGPAAGGPLPTAGQLTAGEVNDFGKWDLWEDVRNEDLAAFREVWKIFPEHRYTAQVTYPGGVPAVNVPVQLTDADGRLLYEAVTDNQGRAELWAGLFDRQFSRRTPLELSAKLEGSSYPFASTLPFSSGINLLELPRRCERKTVVDVAFVVDATGSMGDEISYLSSELLDVMQRSQDSLTGQTVNFASVFYRDQREEYLTRHHDFGQPRTAVVDFVKAQSAGGGGDTPEAVEAALDVALQQLDWNPDAAARLLFLVLDAPPHSDAATVAKLRQLSLLAAREGVRIIPVVCSGMDQSGEYLLRSLALATNGTYTFLTNHSGIGNDHLEPSTDSYKVEKLNNLLVRLIYQYGQTTDCAILAANPQLPPDEVQTDWSVYPNPTFGPATVQLPRAKGTLQVLDNYGKLLRRYEVTTKKVPVDLSGFPSGTYLLRYRYKDEQSSKKIIVNRA